MKDNIEKALEEDPDLYYVTDVNSLGINQEELVKRLPGIWEYINRENR